MRPGHPDVDASRGLAEDGRGGSASGDHQVAFASASGCASTLADRLVFRTGAYVTDVGGRIAALSDFRGDAFQISLRPCR